MLIFYRNEYYLAYFLSILSFLRFISIGIEPEKKSGATSEYPATDTPSLNLQVRGWINIKLSATVVRSVLLKCYRGPQSRSGWISYGVSV